MTWMSDLLERISPKKPGGVIPAENQEITDSQTGVPPKPTPPGKPSNANLLLAVRVLAMMLVIAISVFVFSIRDQAPELAKYGYPGIFLLSILSNATVLLPAPGILFVFAMGAVFNPFWVAVAAGAGSAIGELSGYLAGFGGQMIVQNAEVYQRIHNWMQSHPRIDLLMIFVLAVLPNPFFDLAGIAAGVLRIPLYRFLIVCWIGKTLKMLAIAYLGASITGLTV